MVILAGDDLDIDDLDAELITLQADVSDLDDRVELIEGGLGRLGIAAKLRNDGSTVVGPSIVTVIEFSDPGDVEFDDFAYWDGAQAFVVPAGFGGLHEVNALVPFAADGSGTFRAVYIVLNAFVRIGETQIGPASSTMRIPCSTTGDVQLNDGDLIELYVEHDATGDVAVDGTGTSPVRFSIRRNDT